MTCIREQRKPTSSVRKLRRGFLSVLLAAAVTAVSLPLGVFAISGNDEVSAAGSYDSYTYELKERREENVKHFRNPDGTVTAVMFDVPVHRANSDGEWEDIDNRISASANELATSDSRIKFAKKTTGNSVIFTLHDGNGKITFALDGAAKKISAEVRNGTADENADEITKLSHIERLNSSVIYRGILPETDLEYVVVSNSIKENIILRSALAPDSFVFTVKLNNLSAETTPDGGIAVIRENGETVYRIAPPFMYDAAGNMSDSVAYTLEQSGNNTYKITVSADRTWINDESRVFPVTVDPSLSTGDDNVTDLSVSSSSPTSNTNVSTSLYVDANESAYWKCTTLPKLPNYSYITSAKLSVYCWYGTNYVGAHRVSSGWDSTLVYNDTVGSSPKGDIYSTPIDYSHVSSGKNGVWDITDLVRSWADGSVPNYGICLKPVAGTTVTGTCFFSSSENGDSSHRPRLEITYTDTFGIEDYWSYLPHSVGTAGRGYINLASGNLVFSAGTLSTTDSLMPYTAGMIYNSQLQGWLHTRLNRENPYSFATTAGGWMTTLNQSIVPRTRTNSSGASETYYLYTDSDGTQHAFYASTASGESGIYYDEDGLKLKLTVGTSEFVIENSDKTRYTFTKKDEKDTTTYPGGFLTGITDKSGNRLVFTCNAYGRPQAVKMKPAGGTEITCFNIYYNTKGVIKYFLDTVTNEAVLLHYSDTPTGATGNYYKLLRRIEYAHGTAQTTVANWNTFYSSGTCSGITSDAVCYYEYNTDKRLTEVRDGLGKTSVKYTYDASGRVSSVQEFAGAGYSSAGQKITISYGNGYTNVRTSGTDDVSGNSDDILTTYRFDSAGRCLSTQSTDITGSTFYGASVGEYVSREDNPKAANRLSGSFTVSDPGVNLLGNPLFEKNGSTSLEYWNTTGSVAPVPDAPASLNGYSYDTSFNVKMSAPSSIYQDVSLRHGTYTLSADVMRFWAENTTVELKAQSLEDSAKVYTEKFAFRKELSLGDEAQASLTFTVDKPLGYSTEKYRITLSVTGGSTSDYATVGKIILTNGIGTGAVSRVICGGFNSSFYNGAATVPISDFWKLNGTSSGVTNFISATGDLYLYLNGGSGLTDKYVSQTVFKASEEEKNSFTSSGGSGVFYPQKQYRLSGRAWSQSAYKNAESKFELRAEITELYFENGALCSGTKVRSLEFNRDYDSWQFVSGYISTSANRFIDKIEIICDYSRQKGTAYFDDISFCYIGNESLPQTTEYGDNGLPTKVSDGISEKYYEYNSDDTVKTVITRRSVTTYTYDAKGRLTSVSVYNFLGDPTKDKCGYTAASPKTLRSRTNYIYNSYGLVTSTETYTVDKNTGSVDKKITSSKTYCLTAGSRIFGAPATETDSLGRVTRYFYDQKKGHLLAVISPDGNGTSYTYDSLGRMTLAVPAKVNGSGTGYTSVTGSAKASYGYNSSGQLSSVLTGLSNAAYVRPDGVFVVPVTALKK